MTERRIVWTDDGCAGCGRPPYTRRDGRSYLYSYDDSRPVCRPGCARPPTTEIVVHADNVVRA